MRSAGRRKAVNTQAKRPVMLGFAALLGLLVAGQLAFGLQAHRAFHDLQLQLERIFFDHQAVENWRHGLDAWAVRAFAQPPGTRHGPGEGVPEPPSAAGLLALLERDTDPRMQQLLRTLRSGLGALEASAGGTRSGDPEAGQRRRGALETVQQALEILARRYEDRYHAVSAQGDLIYHDLLLRQFLFGGVVLLVGAFIGWRATRRIEAVERSYAGEIRRRRAIEKELDGHRDHLEELVNQRTMELTYQASHDALTGLFNRYEFERRLELTLSLCHTARCVSSVLYLDLDQFKIINDTCGHMAGDELLRQLAHVLEKHVRRGDTLARLGGDEFGIILDGCDLDQARAIAETIKEAVSSYRFAWHGGVYSVGVSIGVSAVMPDELSRAEVLNRADSACYLAKEEGRNRVRVFTESDQAVERRRREVRWINRVRSAMQDARLELYGQPIVPARPSPGGRPLHCEVLLRIREPGGERVFSPADFIPAAERYGLMEDLDRWVLEHAAREYVARFSGVEAEQRPIMFVNISAQSLSDHDFTAWMEERLRRHGVPRGGLCLEITETAAISNLSRVIQLMSALHEQGVLFALDDFGSGLTSFAYLRSMPLEFLKIEGEFVRDMDHDEVNIALVKAINDVGHVMGLKTIAEFVESERLLRMVRDLGVDYCQGYVFARPLPLAEAFARCTGSDVCVNRIRA